MKSDVKRTVMRPDVATAASAPSVGYVYCPHRYWKLELLWPLNVPTSVEPSYTYTKSHPASSENSLNESEMLMPVIVHSHVMVLA